MIDLPTPKLSDVTAITMSSSDLDRSLEYYQKLGFSKVAGHDFPFRWIQISDGALLIMLKLSNDTYSALTFYVKEIERVVEELETDGLVFLEKAAANDYIKRYLLRSPDGYTVSLITYVEDFKQPPGPTMLTMEQSDYFDPEKYVNKSCGMYGEYAQPVADLDVSIAWWGKLGLSIISRFTAPYPWAILSDGLAIVGLHQTTHFTQPRITFFASDMKEKILKLKQDGLKDFTESGDGNITLHTPEDQYINLFRMGM